MQLSGSEPKKLYFEIATTLYGREKVVEMKDASAAPRMQLLSPGLLIVERFDGKRLSTTAWFIAASPALISLAVAAIAFIGKIWQLTDCAVCASLISFGLLCPLINLHNSFIVRIYITSECIAFERRTIFGKKVRRIYREDIAGLRATVQGDDHVRLSVETYSSGTLSLITLKVEDFDEQASQIGAVLIKPYVLTLYCPQPFVRMSQRSMQYDFVSFDPLNRRVTLDMLDSTPIEILFDEVVAVTVVEACSPKFCSWSEGSHSLEYIYQPAIYFSNGSCQLLQRFSSIESGTTNKSKAFLNASQFADYLQGIMALTTELAPADERFVSPTVSKISDALTRFNPLANPVGR